MAPDVLAYSKQNLRLLITRAQLGLLREKQNVYTDSLVEAAVWATQQFSYSDVAQNIAQSLLALSEENIVQNLPDITSSLIAVRSHLENLHDLKHRSDKAQQGALETNQ